MNNFYVLVGILVLAIVLIVVLTTRFKLHPFFALVIASLVVGLTTGMGLTEVFSTMQEGFGRIMRGLGFLIILGTTLGIALEHNGSTNVMANFILDKVGEKRTAVAMSITGLVVGLPIFCDSGFIVLSGLIFPLAARSGLKVATLAICLATGLYSVHCLIPPHPGASAAVETIGADFGTVMIYGIVVAIPAMIVGYFWTKFQGEKGEASTYEESHTEQHQFKPSAVKAFLPVIVPIVLIALKSFLVPDNETLTTWQQTLDVTGEPVIALTIGILLALLHRGMWKKETISSMLSDSIKKAGSILIIIGGGGAFGAILTATKIGEHFTQELPLSQLGILFPFLLTFILKTAQGSSTVAIITAASIIQPLLADLGLDTETGKLLTVLSMGAGSMTISHANDAYFWVISKFERLSLSTMLSVYSMATLLMGVVSFITIYILSLFL